MALPPNIFHGSAGDRQPSMFGRPGKNALWYGVRPKGRVEWQGPGWYALAAKNTRVIRVG